MENGWEIVWGGKYYPVPVPPEEGLVVRLKDLNIYVTLVKEGKGWRAVKCETNTPEGFVVSGDPKEMQMSR